MRTILLVIMALMVSGCAVHSIHNTSESADAEYQHLEQWLRADLERLEEPCFDAPYDETFELYRFVWM